MTDTCFTCRFWVPNDEPQGITSVHGWGECRCHPPQVVVEVRSSEGRATTFPITTGEQGCGEHKERGAPAPAYPTPADLGFRT